MGMVYSCLTEHMPSKRGTAEAGGDDGDSQMAKRGGVAQLAGVDMRAGAVG